MNRRLAGFTLLEMLVAIVIMLFFMGAVFGVYGAANRAMTLARDDAEVYQTGRVLLDQLNRELSCAYQASTATTCTLIGTNTNGTAVNLTFVTSAHPAPAGQPAGDFCQVTYALSDGSPVTLVSGTAPTLSNNATDNGTNGLYVLADFYPGLEMSNETLTPTLLSPLVAGLDCQYLDTNGNWNSEWDTTQTTLPVAVYVALTLAPRTPGAQPFVLSTTANLGLATVPPATTVTAPTGGVIINALP